MPAPKHLTAQQRLFAERLVLHGNAMRAAQEAGYRHAQKVGMRLERHPKIEAEVKRLRAKLEERRDPSVIMGAEEIQALLTRIARGDEREVELSLSGDPIERPPKLETRRKAAMDLAKLHGLLRERVEHSGPGGAPIELAALSFRELVEYAKLGGDE